MLDDEDLYWVNQWVTLCSAVVSLIGSSIIVQSCLIHSTGKGISKIVLYLGIADLAWSLIDVVSFGVLLAETSYFVDSPLCIWSRLLYQFFGSAAVMWSASISVFLYRRFTVAKKPKPQSQIPQSLIDKLRSHKSMIIYHTLSWGVPFLQCLLLFNHLEPSPQDICLPSEPFFVLFWSFPICVAILISLIVYLLFVHAAVVKAHHSTTSFPVRLIPSRLLLYILVLFVCWIPDILVYSFEEEIPVESRPVVLVIVNGLVELQGFFDCIVYGLTNKEFRRNYEGIEGLVRALLAPLLLPGAVVACLCRKSNKDQSNDLSSSSPLLEGGNVRL